MSLDEILPIHSLQYAPITHTEHSDEIIIPQQLLQKWLEHYPPNMPLLATITNLEQDIVRTVCIGSGFPSNGTERCVFVPSWILDHLGIQDPESRTLVSVAPVLTEIPKATKIVVKPLDNAGYHTDLRAAFEAYLDMFHVLQTGTTLSVPLEELGGYEVLAFVESIEPAATSRLGGEVILEFLEPDGGIPELDEMPQASHLAEAMPEATVAIVTTVATVTIPSADEKEAMRAARMKRFGPS